jgi:hypothetical protein
MVGSKAKLLRTGRDVAVFTVIRLVINTCGLIISENIFVCIEKVPSEIHLKAGSKMIAPGAFRQQYEFTVGDLFY